MRAENFDVQVIIDYLQGTGNDLDSSIAEFYPDMTSLDLTEDDHSEIDNQIFLCYTCGWWCEVQDQNDDGNCVDCCPEEDDEDE